MANQENSNAPSYQQTLKTDILQEKKRRLSAMQLALQKTIDNLGENKSIISYLARFFGKVPFLVKLIVFAALTFPFIIASAFVHTVLFLSIGLTIAGLFILGAFLLYNHLKSSRWRIHTLKEHLDGFTTLLSETISALEKLHLDFQNILQQLNELENKMSQDIERFQQEIKTLSLENDTLKTLTQTLDEKIHLFEKAIENLRCEREQLSKTNADLSATLEEEKNKIKVLSSTINKLSKLQIKDKAEQKALVENLQKLTEGSYKNLNDFQEENKKFETSNETCQKLLQEFKNLLQEAKVFIQPPHENEKNTRQKDIFKQNKKIILFPQSPKIAYQPPLPEAPMLCQSK